MSLAHDAVDRLTAQADRGNATFRFRNASVVSTVAVQAPQLVESAELDDRLERAYAKTGLRAGMLFRLAGIKARRWWHEATTFDEAAADAGHLALEAAEIGVEDIDVLISSSVSRHHLEPSVAASVHHRLGLPAGCLNFDVSNACLGFLNSIHIAASMIDSGTARNVLIVNAEGSRQIQNATVERLCNGAGSADDIFDEFASLTLGSGAAAMVVGRRDHHPDAHPIVGGVTRAGTQHHRLCVGSLDEMHTDASGLLTAGIELVEQTWSDAAHDFDWHDGMDHYVIHQVSKVHTQLVIDRLGLAEDRIPLTFPHLGNVGPASIPITLAGHAPQIQPGDRVLCMGVGSGLNTSFLELTW